MQTKTQQRYYTPEEYLGIEEVAEFKSEYRGGEIVPMTGASLDHNRIAGKVYSTLTSALSGQSYEVFIGDLRLWIPQARLYTYPDVMVIAGKPVFYSDRTDTITNPLMICEVLSKSTMNYDKSEKFDYYRSLPEFREYITIDQYNFHVQQYAKTADNKWLLTDYDSAEAVLSLDSVNFQIQLSEIYQRVNFNLSEP